MRIGRTFQNFRGHGNDLHQSLRYESVRATVGAIQICTREGVEAGVTGDDGDGGVPFAMPAGPAVPIS
jgi:hypothetical protein